MSLPLSLREITAAAVALMLFGAGALITTTAIRLPSGMHAILDDPDALPTVLLAGQYQARVAMAEVMDEEQRVALARLRKRHVRALQARTHFII